MHSALGDRADRGLVGVPMTWVVALVAGLLFLSLVLYATVLRHQGEIKDLKDQLQTWVEWAPKHREEVLADAAAQMKKVEKELRKDAISRSQLVVRGKIAEQLAPFMPGFDFNPRDCRFLGSPIDYVCFEGLSDGDVTDVVFVEIKTGKSRLSVREYQVQKAIEEGLVSYEVIRLE